MTPGPSIAFRTLITGVVVVAAVASAAFLLTLAGVDLHWTPPGHTHPRPTTTTSTSRSTTTTTINAPGTLECSAGPGLRVRTGAVEGAHMHDCRPA